MQSERRKRSKSFCVSVLFFTTKIRFHHFPNLGVLPLLQSAEAFLYSDGTHRREPGPYSAQRDVVLLHLTTKEVIENGGADAGYNLEDVLPDLHKRIVIQEGDFPNVGSKCTQLNDNDAGLTGVMAMFMLTAMNMADVPITPAAELVPFLTTLRNHKSRWDDCLYIICACLIGSEDFPVRTQSRILFFISSFLHFLSHFLFPVHSGPSRHGEESPVYPEFY